MEEKKILQEEEKEICPHIPLLSHCFYIFQASGTQRWLFKYMNYLTVLTQHHAYMFVCPRELMLHTAFAQEKSMTHMST